MYSKQCQLMNPKRRFKGKHLP